MIPSITGQAISEWIWPVVSAGYWVLPKPGEQVWVMFENGDQDAPVWIGKTKQETDRTLHPSAPWARGGTFVISEDLEVRVRKIEEFLGLRPRA
jgi:hypothetical protein